MAVESKSSSINLDEYRTSLQAQGQARSACSCRQDSKPRELNLSSSCDLHFTIMSHHVRSTVYSDDAATIFLNLEF